MQDSVFNAVNGKAIYKANYTYDYDQDGNLGWVSLYVDGKPYQRKSFEYSDGKVIKISKGYPVLSDIFAVPIGSDHKYEFEGDSLRYEELKIKLEGIFNLMSRRYDYSFTDVKEMVKEKEYLLYPNPAVNTINIKTDEPVFSAEIISLEGRKMRSFKFSGGQNQLVLDVNDLKHGTYFIMLNYKDAKNAVKFIILNRKMI